MSSVNDTRCPAATTRLLDPASSLSCFAFHFGSRPGADTKLACQNIGGRVPLAKIVFEILRRDHSIRVEHKSSRIRNAKKWIVLRNAFVQDSQLPNDFRIRVRQQWEMNATPFREIVQNRYAIVTDGRHSQTQFVEFSLILLQLDQLGLAIRSPIRRPVKQDNCALWTQDVR